MNQAALKHERSKMSIWIQSSRPFAFPATLVSVFISAAYALKFYHGDIKWFLFPIVLVCAILFHAGSNMVSDYFDYIKNVDREDTFGSSRVLVEGLLEPKKLLWGGSGVFAAGFILGLILVYYRGVDILLLGLLGLFAAFFYTAKPIGFKYFALGDLGVFTFFGPLMVTGSYLALTGTFDINLFYISIPAGMLVIGILHANNTRDIISDRQAHIKTFAMLIGVKGAQFVYFCLVLGAFFLITLFVLLNILPWQGLLIYVSLPVAIKNLKTMTKAQLDKPSEIAMLDVQTAQHHLMFGILLSIGIILSVWL